MKNDKIIIKINLGQVANDILAKCNLISKAYKDEADADIKADVRTPDSPESRSVICRSVTEAIATAKAICGNYILSGREYDSNELERLVKSKDSVTGAIKEYETETFALKIPNFNVAVTAALTASIHRYVVDYTLGMFLTDMGNERGTVYLRAAAEGDAENIRKYLARRLSYDRAAPTFM